eukprot:Filipodium_phascolosomae@DN2737_c1_g1_i2.p1
MGFLSILRKIKRKEKEMRILFLGLDNAGKTTIVSRIIDGDITDIAPTVGFEIRTIYMNGCRVNIWDIGGQRSIRTFWKNYFESTDGLVWVVDCADTGRLSLCKHELHKLLLEDKLIGASLLIYANKQDLPGAMDLQTLRQYLQLDTITTHNWKLCGCSAYLNEDVLQPAHWLLEDIAKRIFYYSPATQGVDDTPEVHNYSNGDVSRMRKKA